MTTQNLFRNTPFAPIVTWEQISEALIHVTTPETKLWLVPVVMEELKRAAENPRTFVLSLVVQISMLGDASYIPRPNGRRAPDMD